MKNSKKKNFSDVGESALVMQYNNLGVLHHAIGKFHFACHYYQKALKEDLAYNQNSKEAGKVVYYTSNSF